MSELVDKDYLALTLIGEARGEPIEGIIGVANVIRNRVLSNNGLKTYRDICLAERQFSCWNVGDPNYSLLQKLSIAIINNDPASLENISYKQCFVVADAVYNHNLKDNVNNSKNYVTKSRYNLAKSRNAKDDTWIVNMQPVVTLGNHIFLV